MRDPTLSEVVKTVVIKRARGNKSYAWLIWGQPAIPYPLREEWEGPKRGVNCQKFCRPVGEFYHTFARLFKNVLAFPLPQLERLFSPLPFFYPPLRCHFKTQSSLLAHSRSPPSLPYVSADWMTFRYHRLWTALSSFQPDLKALCGGFHTLLMACGSGAPLGLPAVSQVCSNALKLGSV